MGLFRGNGSKCGIHEDFVTEEGFGELLKGKVPEVIEAALLKAASSGKFKGDPGNPGDKGDKGDKGDPGSDYVLTDADKKEIAASAKGDPGADGSSLYYCSNSFQGREIGTTYTFSKDQIATSGREMAIGDILIAADGLLYVLTAVGPSWVDAMCTARGLPVKGVDYYTSEEKAAFTEEIIKGLGGDGRLGIGQNVAGMGFVVDGENVTAGLGAERFNDYGTNVATGEMAHAEGRSTTASGIVSHAEGYDATASGAYSHAEGNATTASGNYSHAEGHGTIASVGASHVQGKFNVKDNLYKYAHILGNGASDAERSNAHTVDWEGNAWFAGEVYIGGTGQDDPDAKKLSAVVGGGVGVNADWNAAEGEPGHVLNRTHYCDGEVVHKLPAKYLPEDVPYSESGIVEFVPECQPPYDVSEAAFYITVADIPEPGAACAVKWNGVEYECTAQDISAMAPGAVMLGDATELGFAGNGEPFMVLFAVRQGENMCMIVPLDGTSELTLSICGQGRIYHPLNERMIPPAALNNVVVVTSKEDADGTVASKNSLEIIGAIESGKAVLLTLWGDQYTYAGGFFDSQLAYFVSQRYDVTSRGLLTDIRVIDALGYISHA